MGKKPPPPKPEELIEKLDEKVKFQNKYHFLVLLVLFIFLVHTKINIGKKSKVSKEFMANLSRSGLELSRWHLEVCTGVPNLTSEHKLKS